MAYMLSSWLKIYVFVTKSRNYCPRKLPGACHAHGDDFELTLAFCFFVNAF